MKFLSVCSGIEAASVAWLPLGWECVGFSEVERFACDLLAQTFPEVENYGDLTKHAGWNLPAFDVLVGGTPCQSFSIAGRRRGLDDPRGQLALSYVALAARTKPRWIFWENVPGVMSSGRGRDFGAFLGALADLGYRLSYRVLDAQYFGLAQRRKRVFVVGRLGADGAAQVLLEPEGVCGDPPTRRTSGQDVAGPLDARSANGGFPGTHGAVNGHVVAGTLQANDGGADENDAHDGRLVAGTLNGNGKAAGSATQQDAESGLLVAYGGNRCSGPTPVAAAVNAKGGSGRMDFETETLLVRSGPLPFDETQITSALNYSHPKPGDPSHPLARGARPPTIAFQNAAGQTNMGLDVECAPPVTQSHGNPGCVQQDLDVRRLTPRECERLQGFPDDWTLITRAGRPAKDGPRYRAIGNSMAVPVVAWIGRRMETVDAR